MVFKNCTFFIVFLCVSIVVDEISMEHLRLYCVTWNVATKSPEQNLNRLLNLPDNLKDDHIIYDFYVISLQEVKAQPQNLLLDVLFDDPWTNDVRTILEKRDYVKAKSVRLQGIIISLFCLRKHVLHLRDIETTYTRTGFSGMWGNKGAVSVRFGIYGCSVCLVNSHLSAHEHLNHERIDDYNTIIKQQEFHVKETSHILFHDYVIWMGDLNFRLNPTLALPTYKIVDAIRRGEHATLLEMDQLKLVMESGEAFSELVEEKPTFPPTYKFEIGTSDYDHKRRPAWCDRILYKVNPHNYENVTLQLDFLSYKSHDEYTQSDHKPVSSDIHLKMLPYRTRYRRADHPDFDNDLQVFKDYTERVVEFTPIQIWYLDEVNTATFKLSLDVGATPSDWIAIFKDGFSSLDDYLSYVYVLKGSSPVMPRQVRSGIQHVLNTFTIQFPESAIRSAGMYRLVYFSQTPQNVVSVLGMSTAFSIQPRDPEERWRPAESTTNTSVADVGNTSLKSFFS